MSHKPKLDRALDWAMGTVIVLAALLAIAVLVPLALSEPIL